MDNIHVLTRDIITRRTNLNCVFLCKVKPYGQNTVHHVPLPFSEAAPEGGGAFMLMLLLGVNIASTYTYFLLMSKQHLKWSYISSALVDWVLTTLMVAGPLGLQTQPFLEMPEFKPGTLSACKVLNYGPSKVCPSL